jgi:hypothetical protein
VLHVHVCHGSSHRGQAKGIIFTLCTHAKTCVGWFGACKGFKLIQVPLYLLLLPAPPHLLSMWYIHAPPYVRLSRG